VAHLYVDPRNPLATLEHSDAWLNTGSPLDNFAWGFPTWILEDVLAPLTASPSGSTTAVEPVSALGPGSSSVPVPVGEPESESEEVCWVESGTGNVACYIDGSIYSPGEIWGPPGDWIPAGEAHPPPINPEFLPDATVHETAGVETDEESDVAIDWGDVLLQAGSTILGGIAGVSPTYNFAPGAASAPPPVIQPTVTVGGQMQAGCAPRKTRTLTIDCATGQEVKRKRRRRPRLLTSGDLGDLAQLQALVGKGSNAMSVAVSKAIR